MIVGEVVNGMRAMTPRTKAKLEENCGLALESSLKLAVEDVGMMDQLAREAIYQILYNALSWTADDVLAQAIADGYKPTVGGVL